MTDRRGMALLTTLWLIATLAALVGAAAAAARQSGAATRNRILLTRAAWARDACHEILLARYAADTVVHPIDTVELGRGTWCTVAVDDPAARLNLNTASPAALRRLFADDALADAVLDWRDADDVPRPLGAEAEWYRLASRIPPRNGPFADPRELRRVRGFDDARVTALLPYLTTRGSGRIDLRLAPPPVLATLPGLGALALETIAQRRAVGDTIRSLDQLLGTLPPPSRATAIDEYQELVAQVAEAPGALVVTTVGGVRGSAIRAAGTLTVVPSNGRLAVIRREIE